MTREEAFRALMDAAFDVYAAETDTPEVGASQERLKAAALAYAKACWCQHCEGHGYAPGYVLETKKLIRLHCSHCDGTGISRCTSECWRCYVTGEEPKP